MGHLSGRSSKRTAAATNMDISRRHFNSADLRTPFHKSWQTLLDHVQTSSNNYHSDNFRTDRYHSSRQRSVPYNYLGNGNNTFFHRAKKPPSPPSRLSSTSEEHYYSQLQPRPPNIYETLISNRLKLKKPSMDYPNHNDFPPRQQDYVFTSSTTTASESKSDRDFNSDLHQVRTHKIPTRDRGYHVISVGQDDTCHKSYPSTSTTSRHLVDPERGTGGGGINKLVINLTDRLDPDFGPDAIHGLARCSLGPATGASVSSADECDTDSTHASSTSSSSTLDRKITDDSRLIIQVPSLEHHHHATTPLSINVSVSRGDPKDSGNPVCPSCNGMVNISQLVDSDVPKIKDPLDVLWDYPFRQKGLHRDSSFHSSGGFTLNGHPGRIQPKRTVMQKLCSSHKVASVVICFSFLVLLALFITLVFMKRRGMMEPM